MQNIRADLGDPEAYLSFPELSPYCVKLEVFEGPLDLLLHLIKKNELSIADIPMALITRQYLDYIGLMKSLNLNVAGEFLVMASSLIHIKSKMLLPVSEEDGEEEQEDPRDELVRRLVDYKRFKDAAEGLERRELLWRDVYRRTEPPSPEDGADAVPVQDLSLFDLLDALRHILERVPEKRDLDVIVDELSIKDRIAELKEMLKAVTSLAFHDLFEDHSARQQIIVTFLAMLELIRLGLAGVEQVSPFETIRLFRRERKDTPGPIDDSIGEEYLHPPSPKTPALVGEEGAKRLRRDVRPNHLADDRGVAEGEAGFFNGTPGLPEGLHEAQASEASRAAEGERT